jgi:hypothetical protein
MVERAPRQYIQVALASQFHPLPSHRGASTPGQHAHRPVGLPRLNMEWDMSTDDRKPGERPPKPRNTPSAKERGKPQPWLPQPEPDETRKKR